MKNTLNIFTFIAILFMAGDHLAAVTLLGYLYMIGFTAYCFNKAQDPIMVDDGFIWFVGILMGLFWPVSLIMGSIADKDFRKACWSPLSFLVINKYYYLQNPVVLRELDNETPNKEENHHWDKY